MAGYSYVVIDNKGKERKGSIEADTEEKAVALLKADNLIPVEVTEQSLLTQDINLDIGGKPKARDYSIFCRQFVSMTQAGVTLIDALNMLGEQTNNKKLTKAIKEIQAAVEKGESLTEAMRAQKFFPSLLCSMTEAGEASGSLDIAFDRMATHFEKDAKVKGMIKKAAIYPVIVCIVAVVVVIIMLTTVIPNFTSMFADMDMELPAITKGVMVASDFMMARWYIIVAVIVGVVVLLRWFKSTSYGETLFAKIGLKMPLFGQLTVKTSAARFARTVSTLLAAGIALVDAIEITANVMDNRIVKDALLACKEEIVQGVPLSVPLKDCGLFPPMVYQMTKIGEEAGDMEGLLEKLADYYEEEVEMATQSLMAAMEPLIIVVLAGIVGVLIGAVMAPMASM
ncbi:MAG TPA: type II secretion system F family protein, partial [Lachnospiraceae bacterium]|nr:type II secretion system F family protein [Lachnospiraceae bacterium]